MFQREIELYEKEENCETVLEKKYHNDVLKVLWVAQIQHTKLSMNYKNFWNWLQLFFIVKNIVKWTILYIPVWVWCAHVLFGNFILCFDVWQQEKLVIIDPVITKFFLWSRNKYELKMLAH